MLRSTNTGAVARTYVQVQIVSRITRSSDWKLKSADYTYKMGDIPLWIDTHSDRVTTQAKEQRAPCRLRHVMRGGRPCAEGHEDDAAVAEAVVPHLALAIVTK